MNTRIPIAIITILLLAQSVIAAEDQAGKEKALDAIKQSESIIKDMQTNNFSTVYMNDTLLNAKRVFNQVMYAEILKGNVTASPGKVQEAKQALSLIDWRSLSYEDVLTYTDQIKAREQQAFAIHDSIVSENIEIKSYKNQINVTAARNLIEQAQKAFYEDRYDDANALLKNAADILETTSSETILLAGIKRNVGSFLQTYWRQISLLLIIAIATSAVSYPLFNRRLLKNKIKRLKAEEQVLIALMKEAQTQRFKEDKISGLVYNIRMKNYQGKFQRIKEKLPVLEKRLKK